MIHTYYQLNWSYFEGQDQGRTHRTRKFPTLTKLALYIRKHNIDMIEGGIYEVYEITEKKLENSVKDRS